MRQTPKKARQTGNLIKYGKILDELGWEFAQEARRSCKQFSYGQRTGFYVFSFYLM